MTRLRCKLPCGCEVEWEDKLGGEPFWAFDWAPDCALRGNVIPDDDHWNPNGTLHLPEGWPAPVLNHEIRRKAMVHRAVSAGYAMAAARGVGPWVKEPRLLHTREKLPDALASIEKELIRGALGR